MVDDILNDKYNDIMDSLDAFFKLSDVLDNLSRNLKEKNNLSDEQKLLEDVKRLFLQPNVLIEYKDKYDLLKNISERFPELNKDILRITSYVVEDKNQYMMKACSLVKDIYKQSPNLTKEVFQTMKSIMKHPQNDSRSFVEEYKILNAVYKNDPEIKSELLNSVRETVKSPVNDYLSFVYAYNLVYGVVDNKNELKTEVENSFLLNRGNNVQKLQALSLCMRNFDVNDFPEVNSQQKTLLTAAYNLRLGLPKEIEYAYKNMSLEQIAEYDFSGQQKCSDIIMQKLASEKNLNEEETSKYRKKYGMDELYIDNVNWLVEASFKSADVFGKDFTKYIEKVSTNSKIYDAVSWLPESLGKEKNASLSSFITDNIKYTDKEGSTHVRPISQIKLIGENWSYLNLDHKEYEYQNILEMCEKRNYQNQEYDEFAKEAAKWGISKDQYKSYENLYKAELKVPEVFDSDKTFAFGPYQGKFLSRNDVRIGFIEKYMDSVKDYESNETRFITSLIKDPNSQLFVVENDKGQVVSASLARHDTKGQYQEVIFDNVEISNNQLTNPMVYKVYDMASKYLCDEKNYSKATMKSEKQMYSPLINSENINVEKTQVLLRQNDKAVPLKENKENTFFVRDACQLDNNMINKVYTQCSVDKQVIADYHGEKNETGLVLVDKKKGVVGYCLYDKQDKKIYDMAVLPEYVSNQDKSSKYLFAEMMRRVKSFGGEWKFDLKNETINKYVETMSNQGVISLNKEQGTFKLNDSIARVHQNVKNNVIVKNQTKDR